MRKAKKVIDMSNSYSIDNFNQAELTNLDIIKEMNHHSIHSNLEHLKQKVIEFAKVNNFPEINIIKKIDESYLGSLGVICQLRLEGKKLPELYCDKNLIEKIKKKCAEQKNRQENKKEVITPVVSKKVSKTDILNDKVNILVQSIDSAFNLFLTTHNPIIMPEVLKTASKEELDLLAVWCQDSWKRELECLAVLKTSEYMAEAYSNLNVKQINSLKKFYAELIDLVINATPAKKQEVAKKVRVKKIKIIPLDKVLSKFVFLPSYNTIESFNSKEIFKSNELYLVDIQYSRIIHLVSEENKNFGVKSRAIINIDETKSGFKRVSKKNLDFIIGSLNKANKVSSKKIFDNLKNTLVKFPGRVSEDTLLLKNF